MVDRETGDLVRDDGVVRHRGQFVAVGPDATNLTVHGAHPGDCLYKLRIRRNQDGNPMRRSFGTRAGQTRTEVILLPSHSFDQANVRREGVRAGILAKREDNKTKNEAVRGRLGFTLGTAAHGDTPQPRGDRRSARRRQ
jgi:hypothetical protein